MVNVDITIWVPDLMDWGTIRIAGIVPVEAGHMVFGGGCHIARHFQAGDQRPSPHLALGIDVRHFAHDEQPAHDLDEVALFAKALKVRAKTERLV